jgi:hypothetical protein
MNALLMAAGLRITSGLGAHMKRIETGEELMPNDTELFERIDDARQERNRITYDGAATDADVVDEFTNDVETLADKVANYIDAANQLYAPSSRKSFTATTRRLELPAAGPSPPVRPAGIGTAPPISAEAQHVCCLHGNFRVEPRARPFGV